MNYYPLTQTEYGQETLRTEYRAAREVGKLRLGAQVLFFRNGLKTYYIPYQDIKRCFRRVMMIPAKLCCGKGELPVENLVVCDAQKEVAQIQLPGTNAARILMEELKRLIPDAEFGRPPKAETE